jgi:hypothetical protein
MRSTPEDRELADGVDRRLRDAFPADAGLKAERTFALYDRLRAQKPAASVARRRLRGTLLRAGTALALAAAITAVALFAGVRTTGKPTPASPLLPVPERALAAIATRSGVLHFRSTAEESWPGVPPVHTDEEMWLDRATGAGRARTRRYGAGGAVVSTVTVVADKAGARVTREFAGSATLSEHLASLDGPLRRELGKLDAYRNMLQSHIATVTGEGSADGQPTYLLRAEMPGLLGPDGAVVMTAEIRKDDFLPVRYGFTFTRQSDGAVLAGFRRTFTSFEMIDSGRLPSGFLSSSAGSDTPLPAIPRGTRPTSSPDTSAVVY